MIKHPPIYSSLSESLVHFLDCVHVQIDLRVALVADEVLMHSVRLCQQLAVRHLVKLIHSVPKLSQTNDGQKFHGEFNERFRLPRDFQQKIPELRTL